MFSRKSSTKSTEGWTDAERELAEPVNSASQVSARIDTSMPVFFTDPVVSGEQYSEFVNNLINNPNSFLYGSEITFQRQYVMPEGNTCMSTRSVGEMRSYLADRYKIDPADISFTYRSRVIEEDDEYSLRDQFAQFFVKVKLRGGGKKKKNQMQQLVGSVGKKALKQVARALSSTVPGAKPVVDIAEKRITKAVNKALKKRIGSGAYLGGGSYLGSGAYGNSLMVDMQHPNPPMRIASTRDETDTIVIRHRDYLLDLYTPSTQGAFTPYKIPINPGLPGAFPFAAQIASNFEKYVITKMVFEFVSVVGEYTGNGSLGTVSMLWNMNPSAALPSNLLQIQNMSNSITMNSSDNFSLGVECEGVKGGSGWLYTRSGSVPSGQDVKTYDPGVLCLATSGLPTTFSAGSKLGSVYVEYEVKLASGRLYDGLFFNELFDSFMGNSGCSLAMPYGTAPYKNAGNLLGGTLTKSANNYYVFPDNFVGTVRVTMYSSGTTMGVATIALNGNIVGVQDLISGSANSQSSKANSSTESIAVYSLSVSAASVASGNYLYFTLAAGSAPTISCLSVEAHNPSLGLVSSTGTVPSSYVLV